MVPEFNESLNSKMEQASLRDLMPGFDRDAEWLRLSQKLQPAAGAGTKKSWAYAAAIALLLCCGGLSWLIMHPKTGLEQQASVSGNDTMREWIKSVVTDQSIVAPSIPKEEPKASNNEPVAAAPKPMEQKATPPVYTVAQPAKVSIANTTTNTKKGYDKKRVDELLDYYRTKEFICNGTPCPLQICILQTVRCLNTPPAAVATCSTIEPDQARQLKYKINNTHDCNVTIDEIRITRVNTGETIVLNANSKPSTAQDLFDYITGEKEGDLLTGMFHSDCNKNSSSQNLTIDKNYGDFTIK